MGSGGGEGCDFKLLGEDLTEKVTPESGRKEEPKEHSRQREEASDSRIRNSPCGAGSMEFPRVSKQYYYSAEHTASAK